MMWSTAKVTSLVVVFGLPCACGCFGCVFIKVMADKLGFSLQRTISYLNCLAGGVFLASSVIFLLPEAREKVEEALVMLDFDTEYPFTELLAGIGFILILLLETGAHTCCHPGEPHQDVTMEVHGRGNSRSDGAVYAISIDSIREETMMHKNGDTKSADSKSIDSGVHTNSATNIENGPQTTVDMTEVSSLNNESQKDKNKTAAKITGVVLLIALSLHMVFEGLALGLLDNDDQVWTLLFTLCAHKVLVFFTIGFQLYEMLHSLVKSFVVIVVLSLVSPVGIIIGIALTSQETSTGGAVATGVLQGLATGTFVYVTFFELLAGEFIKKTPNLPKVVVTFVGFAAAAAFGILQADEGHSDGGMVEVSTITPNITTATL